MKKKNIVSLVYSLENTFVKKDIDYLNTITKKLYLHSSRPHKDPFRFLWNRVSELFFSLFYVSRSKIIFCWFNDYHAFFPLLIASLFSKKSVLIVGGYDAVADQTLKYGLFYRTNWRQKLAKINYHMARCIWVVDETLALGCPNAKSQERILSGIKTFLPKLSTPIQIVPTGYDPIFWKATKEKTPKTILTVANVPDLRTYQRKGIDLFMKLAKALPDYKFTLAGIDFKLQKHDTLPQNVTLLGTQDAKQLREIYSAHTYYFQGSRVEGLPNVLCEAMLCECIAIGRNVFGMPKAIGDTGFLFNPHEQWNKMIHFITQDKPELGKKGRARVQKQFHQKRRYDTLLETINKE